MGAEERIRLWMMPCRPWWRGPEAVALAGAAAGITLYVSAPHSLSFFLLALPVLHVLCCLPAFGLARKLQRQQLVSELLVTPISGKVFTSAFRRVFWQGFLLWALVALPCFAAIFWSFARRPGLDISLTGSFIGLWLFLTQSAVLWVIFWTAVVHGVWAGLMLIPFYYLLAVIVTMFGALAGQIHWALEAVFLLAGTGYVWANGNVARRNCDAEYIDMLRARLEAAEK